MTGALALDVAHLFAGGLVLVSVGTLQAVLAGDLGNWLRLLGRTTAAF